MNDTLSPLESSFRPAEIVAAKAISLAQAGANLPSEFRELRWLLELAPLNLRLFPAEYRGLHMECGFAQSIGWNILSQVLGIVTGHDPDTPVPDRQPHAFYTPRYNYGGWVRIFRSTKAALPQREDVIAPLVDSYLKRAASGSAMEEAVRGLLGIPANRDLTETGVREALLSSDLFTAPWMVATWTSPQGWVVLGNASRFLEGLVRPDQECGIDLLTREHADQSMGFDETGLPILFSGPSLGLEVVIQAVELALRMGYRLDLIHKPIETELDAWEDGIRGFGETPLMGYVIPGPVGHFTVAFQFDGAYTRLEGIGESDYELFRGVTGINPAEPLRNADYEVLAMRGTPIFGRFATFAPATKKPQE